ncbi:MAG: class I SAM-dependent methyltransferase [Nitrososphaerales archaeon]
MRGLEIGPLAHPRVRKDEGPIRYVDHASADELKRKYSANKAMQELGLLGRIVDVDYVLGEGQTISKVVAQDAPFDYVIASHLIEHIPDPVSWMADVARILEPGGILSLVIPDKRYCFDINRRTSDISDIVDAHLRALTRPTYKQVYDFSSRAIDGMVDTAAVWAGTADYAGVVRTDCEDPDVAALEVCRSLDGSDEFVDVHCHVFTPDSFLTLFEKLIRLRLVDFEVAHFVSTPVNELEFYVSLRLLERGEDPGTTMQRQLTSVITAQRGARAEHAISKRNQSLALTMEVSEREQKLLSFKRRFLEALRGTNRANR